MICKKEWQHFFGSITGYLALAIFLLMSGLLLFIFPNSSLLTFGYATLQPFFDTAPWLLLFLIPTVTMRSFADEYKQGTFELLKTQPLTSWQIVVGKYFGACLIISIVIIATIIYAFTIQHLSYMGGMDLGAAMGSYIGLLFLSAVFIAIGICISSFTSNTVAAFIAAAFFCFIIYIGFETLSELPSFKGGSDYYIEMIGINFHYKNMSKGVIDTRDIIYFICVIAFFLWIAYQNIDKQNGNLLK